ncbi:hypothetical protein Hanom_Chr08g00756451 [Helianthus anomalus]
MRMFKITISREIINNGDSTRFVAARVWFGPDYVVFRAAFCTSRVFPLSRDVVELRCLLTGPWNRIH